MKVWILAKNPGATKYGFHTQARCGIKSRGRMRLVDRAYAASFLPHCSVCAGGPSPFKHPPVVPGKGSSFGSRGWTPEQGLRSRYGRRRMPDHRLLPEPASAWGLAIIEAVLDTHPMAYGFARPLGVAA